MPKKADPTGFGPRLKQLREEAGLSQQGLADRIGFHRQSVAKLEAGIREPTWSTVVAVVRALGISSDRFLPAEGGEEPAAAPARRGRPAKARAKGESEVRAPGKRGRPRKGAGEPNG